MKLSHVLAPLALLCCCTTLATRPEVTPQPAEAAATRRVERLLVIPTTGTGEADEGADVNQAVPVAAYGSYAGAVVLAAGLAGAAQTLGMPAGVAPFLTVSWQVAFYRWVEAGRRAKARPKRALTLAVPGAGRRPPSGDAELSRLAAALRQQLPELTAVATAVDSGDASALAATVAGAAQPLAPVDALLHHLARRLRVTYVLVSHVDGDRAAFLGGAPVTLHVALVNVETGKFRYYAHDRVVRGDHPGSYEKLVTVMAREIFAAAKDVDQIER